MGVAMLRWAWGNPAVLAPAAASLVSTGLTADYDFSDASKLWQDTGRTSAITADGQTIKGVTDGSGNGNHLSHATGCTYKTAIQNGLSVSRYVAGSNQTLEGPAAGGLVSASAGTLLAVVNITPTVSSGNGWLNNTIVGEAGDLWGLFGRNSATVKALGYIWDGANKIVEATYSAGTWAVLAMRRDASKVYVSVNGGTESETAAGAIVGALGILRVAHGSGGFSDMDLGRVRIHNVDLGTAVLATQITALKAAWGIA